jgi:hypothetical protein
MQQLVWIQSLPRSMLYVPLASIIKKLVGKLLLPIVNSTHNSFGYRDVTIEICQPHVSHTHVFYSLTKLFEY